MQELLYLQSSQFELSIWTNDIFKRKQVYQATFGKRNIACSDLETLATESTYAIKLSPSLDVDTLVVDKKEYEATNHANSIGIEEPIFFENTQYQFEWEFSSEVESAYLTHRSQNINDSFRFKRASLTSSARLTGTLNTGNDVGWMRLPLEFIAGGKVFKSNISFEVLPTKMDMHSDLPAMYKMIDKEFPLWRFSLLEKTEQNASKGQQRGHFPLLWLANFNNLRKRFEDGLKVITQAPHSRLQSYVSYSKADRLKGRLPQRLSEKVKEDIKSKQFDKRYKVEKRRLSVNTPENRFIKMVVTNSKKCIAKFENKLREANKAPDKQRLSNSFLNELQEWQKPLQKTLNQTFFKEVSTYTGLNSESLVLQQKTGYSAVYRVWQELKYYLDVFEEQSSVSMKSVAEIYEVWCFLEIRNILINELRFEDKTKKLNNLQLNDFLEYKLEGGLAGAFEFEREDGLKAKLLHEPWFSKSGNPIKSYLVSQNPDIVLEVTLPKPNSKRFIWIFDAKYRIKTKQGRYDEDNIDTTDFVPDDAINQMHRYRDALIHINKESQSESISKSRPIFGAFALYPGYFKQEANPRSNPYDEAIHEVGIGAFALLPSAGGKNGNYWLTEFLRKQLGDGNNSYVKNSQEIEESLYVQEAARIPYAGMKQMLYPDLVFTAALGGLAGRDKSYFERFENGLASWYHTPLATFNSATKKSKLNVLKEIRYLAIASTSAINSRTKSIKKVWPVIGCQIVARSSLTIEQAGKVKSGAEECVLFKLGKPLTLSSPVESVPHRPINRTMKLTTLSNLEKVSIFKEVEKVYSQTLN
ncbi:restriction endonuclease-like protein [Pseudoalteromonas prydzensis]|uniref:restriction endonuclease-like protein n=1 Tax=Pseudoalteromonas prydzensis TaxID=182141 RepID=UPI0024BC7D4A|nr:restriction endonuclease-like protein [Pseudoalteromonas prydzensis]